jgi:alanyl-tRNA synthetase
MKAGPEAYRLKFFIDNGFERKECTSCGRFFWTLDHERTVCGDSPCSPYSFIGAPPTKKKYKMGEMREKFLSFFERRGHRRVERSPVVARWRDDIFLTIASIAVFQPHVTSGEVPPPYNPLTISQPCIRMNDLDNVGKTGGRHLSIFEMMAHHAFNSEDHEIYWKEETVAYHHELMTKDLGIDGKEISYIEHWWEGGGDAGPDLEGIVRGLEVSTLVFMQYKKIGDKYVDLPLRIVDTGYGLERLTWLSQGTPTAFEAIYGRLTDEFLELARIERPDPKILAETTRLAGLMDVVDAGSLEVARRRVADSMHMDASTLQRQLEPMENVLAILDHTKVLTFMFSDGIVPSNVQVGYLARLIVRRVKRMMDALGMATPLSDLLKLQIGHWRNQFPDLTAHADYVAKVADLEVGRYLKTVEQGTNLVIRMTKDRGIIKGGKLPLEKLIELYDSNGLPPEIVKEICQGQGIKVDIPDTFDTIVAERHATTSPLSSANRGADPLEGMPSLPATELLYYSAPKLRTSKAKVLFSDGKRIVLDRTIFYPEGGGQLSDTGTISGKGIEARVNEAQKSRGIVIHFVEGAHLKVGEEVDCAIDWGRRMNLARHHSSTHILLGSARRVLGEHVWQQGAQKEVEKSRLDISHFEKITPDQLREIEFIANRIILENRSIKTYFEERNKAEQKFGMRLYQGGVVRGSSIRVVEVEGWDVEACGGIHCTSTGEIGLLKIVKSERIQDGVERLEFVSGEPALKYTQQQDATLEELSRILNTPKDRVEKAANKLVEENVDSRKETERLRRNIAIDASPSLLASAEVAGRFKLISKPYDGLTGADLIPIASRVAELSPSSVIIFASIMDGSIIVIIGSDALKAGLDAGRLTGELTKALGGRGGGRNDMGQGKVEPAQISHIAEGLSRIKELLAEASKKE